LNRSKELHQNPHQPVLLQELLSFFENRPIETFIDGTLGNGGHALALLETHPELKQFIGIDQDPTALNLSQERLSSFSPQITLLRGNFRHLQLLLSEIGIQKVDGILLDIGTSSMQLDSSQRGFSFKEEAPLDMRMDPQNPTSAATLINHASEEELAYIFRELGEIPSWRAVTRTILQARQKQKIQTTKQLSELLSGIAKTTRSQKIHPMTLVFQALRISVNDELGALEAALPQAIDLLRPGGRLAVITFHSLEDRLVKNLFRHAAKSWEEDLSNPFTGKKEKEILVTLVTKKPITASLAEIRSNPRSRSAKLRVVEKISNS
jgi:16S rRNA (cytosine1402-N4)-methyltransferase